MNYSERQNQTISTNQGIPQIPGKKYYANTLSYHSKMYKTKTGFFQNKGSTQGKRVKSRGACIVQY